MNRVSRVKNPSASPRMLPSGWHTRTRSSRLIVIVDGPTWTGKVIGLPSAASRDLGQHPRRLFAADLADVLLVLEDDTEGLVDQGRRQLLRAERQEGGGPIERLGDARHLGQVGLAQSMDE